MTIIIIIKFSLVEIKRWQIHIKFTSLHIQLD